MPNRLAAERSPYLLQHAHNPVDWYPWGNEAFERARREDRPIFLSVGYSTCHWCHVMERESFEDPEIAARLNCGFVPVKVDREERPDVDRVYMAFVQATTGAGGWPMSVWLTPDLKPFFGGTYFPPDRRWGRPGFGDVLAEITRAWTTDRARVLESADRLLARLVSVHRLGLPGDPPADSSRGPVAPAASLDGGVTAFRKSFDRRRGGFGEAPKFPRPSELLFLLREHARTGAEDARTMAVETLRAMALGGLRDHVGGGFHRYSVDAVWRIPHFEKMLYDQAQLAIAFLEAWQSTGDELWVTVAEETLDYVLRDLTDSRGGFHSAEDADSAPHAEAPPVHPGKAEGAFYLWRLDEIRAALGPDADVVRWRFGVEAEGNAPHDPHGEFAGRNQLYIARGIDEVARLTGRSPEDIVAALARARHTLFELRSRRPRPDRDDKVITAWNGLTIAALARAARVLASTPGPARAGASSGRRAERYLAAATRAAAFAESHLWNPDTRTLLRRYRAGEAAIPAYSEDYAALAWGLLELFQATGEARWLEWALDLHRTMDRLFWDDREGGWFATTGTDSSVLLRLKEDYDGAEPAASSIAAMNLLALGSLGAEIPAAERVERTLARFGPELGRLARAVPHLAAVLSAYYAGMLTIVVVGARDRDDALALWRTLAGRYLPFAVVVPVEPGINQDRLARLLPIVGAMTMRGGRATAYVCRNFTCREPATTPEALAVELDQHAPAAGLQANRGEP